MKEEIDTKISYTHAYLSLLRREQTNGYSLTRAWHATPSCSLRCDRRTLVATHSVDSFRRSDEKPPQLTVLVTHNDSHYICSDDASATRKLLPDRGNDFHGKTEWVRAIVSDQTFQSTQRLFHVPQIWLLPRRTQCSGR